MINWKSRLLWRCNSSCTDENESHDLFKFIFSQLRLRVWNSDDDKKSGNIDGNSLSRSHKIVSREKSGRNFRHKFPQTVMRFITRHDSLQKLKIVFCGFLSFSKFRCTLISFHLCRHPYNWSMQTLNNYMHASKWCNLQIWFFNVEL